jgi:flavin reductase (DIM6/NTAB) family NADH-FMN oxidoreductase RutF
MDTLSRFKPVALEHASRLINHGPTVLITSSDGSRHNVMAAAWSMPVEFTPPRIAVVIDKKTFTRELIHASGTFGICVPGSAAMDLTFAVGSVSGRDADKFAQFEIEAVKGPVLGLPLLERGIAVWMECKLIPEKHTENAYDTCFCEVVSAAADPRVFSGGHWVFDEGNRDLHTIHHLGAGNFALASNAVKAKSLAG